MIYGTSRRGFVIECTLHAPLKIIKVSLFRTWAFHTPLINLQLTGIMVSFKYLSAFLLFVSTANAWVYPQCEFSSDCKKKEICCYTSLNHGVPPAQCMATLQCASTS